MTGQQLLDALEYLPDQMLEETAARRRKTPAATIIFTSLAACLCIVVGIWFYPGGMKATNAKGTMDGAESVVQDSIHFSNESEYPFLICQITGIDKETLTLFPLGTNEPEEIVISMESLSLSFSPEIGQTVKLLYSADSVTPLKPIALTLYEQED